MSMPRISNRDADHLDGLLSAFDDLPDGAWRAACESAIAECPRFRNRAPYDVWMAWCWKRRDRTGEQI